MKPQVIQELSTIEGRVLGTMGHESQVLDSLVSSGVIKVNTLGQFRAEFVGLATAVGENFQFPPKYLPSLSEESVDSEMKLVVRVLRKYARRIPPKHNDARYLQSATRDPQSRFAIADALISDYLANGTYQPRVLSRKLNKNGTIDWPTTVNQVIPYFSRRRPIYVDVVTRISSADSSNWAVRLHLAAIEDARKNFGGLLGYQHFSLDHEMASVISSVPSESFVRSILQQELNRSYTDRSIKLLRLLQSWYLQARPSGRNRLTLFGLGSFHTVWEELCSVLFSNESSLFQKHIPKPRWKSKDGEMQEAPTLVPDIMGHAVSSSGRKVFLLLDAKYYRILMPPNLAQQPGISDITKQLAYEQVLNPKILDLGFDKILNYFLFPRWGGKLFEFAGHVEIPGLNGGPIAAFYLNTSKVMMRYLQGRPLSNDEKLDFVSEGGIKL